MNYTASISDFFKSPKWMMNMLLGGVCVLIPLVGPIVVLGWTIVGFWGRQDDSCETFPPFDFANFSKYLEKGAWPFIVSFVASIAASMVLMPLSWGVMMPLMFLGQDSSGAGTAGCIGGVAALGMIVFWAALMVALVVLLMPLTLRATLTQDFAKAFNLQFMNQFLTLTWKECLLSSLFLGAASIVLTSVGMLVFCIGAYFAGVVIYFAWMHLEKQLYELYLSRGGEPVPVSPKLLNIPPPLPQPADQPPTA